MIRLGQTNVQVGRLRLANLHSVIPGVRSMPKSPRKETVSIYTGSAGADKKNKNEKKSKSPSYMQRLRRRWLSLSALGVVLVLALMAYRASVLGPHFYQKRVSIEHGVALEAGDDVEQSLAQFHNDIRRHGDWKIELKEQSINGWLAAHLPEKLPHALPSQVSDPRVAIDESSCKLAFRAKLIGIRVVVWGAVEPYITDEPNVLAIRIKSVRSGWFPLPISGFTESFSTAANNAGFRVRWSQDQGDPLALITIPDEVPEFPEFQLEVSEVFTGEGRLVVRGATRIRE